MSTEEGSQARYKTRQAVDALTRSLSGSQRPLDALQAVRHAQHDLSDARDFWTRAARRDGATWSQIAAALDMTRQAVQQAHRRRHLEDETRTQLVRFDRLPAPPRRRRFRWPI